MLFQRNDTSSKLSSESMTVSPRMRGCSLRLANSLKSSFPDFSSQPIKAAASENLMRLIKIVFSLAY
jgi:hypothetical protein